MIQCLQRWCVWGVCLYAISMPALDSQDSNLLKKSDLNTTVITENKDGFLPWSRDIAIISLESYPLSKNARASIQALANLTATVGLSADFVDVDIFLPENKKQRQSYCRILIPSQAFHFTPVMYDGMADYVRQGGLLISNSNLLGIDQNGDRKFNLEDGDTYWSGKRGHFNTLGVYGHSGATITNLTVEVECPLSTGLPVSTVLIPENPLRGRVTLNKSAEVIITGDGAYKEQILRNRPMLSYKHIAHGACIYVNPDLLTQDHWMRQIAINCLSAQTLAWLTLQE